MLAKKKVIYVSSHHKNIWDVLIKIEPIGPFFAQNGVNQLVSDKTPHCLGLRGLYNKICIPICHSTLDAKFFGYTINEFIRCFHQFVSRIFSTNFSQFEKESKLLIGPKQGFFSQCASWKRKYNKYSLKKIVDSEFKIREIIWWICYFFMVSFGNAFRFSQDDFNKTKVKVISWVCSAGEQTTIFSSKPKFFNLKCHHQYPIRSTIISSNLFIVKTAFFTFGMKMIASHPSNLAANARAYPWFPSVAVIKRGFVSIPETSFWSVPQFKSKRK